MIIDFFTCMVFIDFFTCIVFIDFFTCMVFIDFFTCMLFIFDYVSDFKCEMAKLENTRIPELTEELSTFSMIKSPQNTANGCMDSCSKDVKCNAVVFRKTDTICLHYTEPYNPHTVPANQGYTLWVKTCPNTDSRTGMYCISYLDDRQLLSFLIEGRTIAFTSPHDFSMSQVIQYQSMLPHMSKVFKIYTFLFSIYLL